jgi:heat shock protein HslJ
MESLNKIEFIMKKTLQLLVIISVVLGCKSSVTTQKELVKTEPTPAYNQQMENVENGIYFRATGNEPEWNLKISETAIEFRSLKPGFESFNSVHVEPILAMDANVKMYKVATELGKMTIQIMQRECVNTMSGKKENYSVSIAITINTNQTIFNGCGGYITDPRLHDIWVLEKLNNNSVSTTDFSNELPNFEINSYTNNFLGFAGCNRMNGTVFFERGLLRFTNIITTRMACSYNKENEFLKALQSTTSYRVENMKLILTNPSGEKLIFKKVD